MKGNCVRLGGLLALMVIPAFATPAAAQVDVTGSWAMEVTTDTGTTTPSMTLQQDGNKITGHYSSATLGEADLAGMVDGSDITITIQADLQGQTVPVVYKATLDDEGVMSGTIDVAGGTVTGTFSAKRS